LQVVINMMLVLAVGLWPTPHYQISQVSYHNQYTNISLLFVHICQWRLKYLPLRYWKSSMVY